MGGNCTIYYCTFLDVHIKQHIYFLQDPVIRRIWDEKVVVDYEIFPYNRVRKDSHKKKNYRPAM